MAGLWRMGFAGDSFNTLWALRALTGEATPADYVSAFGDDPFSRDQIAFLASATASASASSPVIAGARPGLYAITLTGAERSFTYWRADAAARRLADDPAALAKSLENRALVYFSGISFGNSRAGRAAAACSPRSAQARRQGSLIAFDPNYRPRLWPDAEAARAAIVEALAVVDIALPTFPDEQALFGDADPQADGRADCRARRRRDRGQERRGAGADLRSGEAVASRAGGPRRLARRHDRRRRFLQRRLSRRAACRRARRPRRRARRMPSRPPSCRCAARWRRSRRLRDGVRRLSHSLNRYSVICR